MTTSVSISVPEGREEGALWLSGQSPSLAADLLDSLRRLFSVFESSSVLDEEETRRRIVSEVEEEWRERVSLLTRECEEREERVASFRSDLERRETLFLSLEGRMERAFEEERERWREKVSFLEGEVRRKECEMRDEFESRFSRFDTVFGSLVGNSSKKGEVGELFVKTVFSGMELGTLTHVGRVKGVGYADYVWRYEGKGGRPLVCLVEVKFSLSGNSSRDVDKFEEDVREASHTGRACAALFLSLVDRVEGKAKISLGSRHGVPVLWAGRGADDDLSARSLVEMAFTTLAHVWPQIASSRECPSSLLLSDATSFAKESLSELEKLGTHLRAIERANEVCRAETAKASAARERAVLDAYKFRAKHDSSFSTPTEEEFRSLLVEKVREYHSRKKKYPSHLKDVGMEGGGEETVLREVTEALKRGKRKKSEAV